MIIITPKQLQDLKIRCNVDIDLDQLNKIDNNSDPALLDFCYLLYRDYDSEGRSFLSVPQGSLETFIINDLEAAE
jgi:hypothetical protein